MLSTEEHMRGWSQVQGFLFFREPNESRDHMFFACLYTYTIWIEVIGTLLDRPPDPEWDNTLHHLTTHRFDLTYILLRLVIQATIYMLWRKRNERKHHKKPG